MRVRIVPGSTLGGDAVVPGDKSIAHRWLILAATADGSSRLRGLPLSLDARSTAACLASFAPKARPTLDVWCRNAPPGLEDGGSTWNASGSEPSATVLEVEGDGRDGLREPVRDLDCGNSGTSMRLLSGVLAAAPFRSLLVGDESLSVRPMERVAGPLRRMGAAITTRDGHAPIEIEGGRLHGIVFEAPVPSAQVKGAVLLAGVAAEGSTRVVEATPTRDHTERALAALGAPIAVGDGIEVSRFQHRGFEAEVPGDPSSAAFLVAAAALTGSSIAIRQVGLNPSRLHFLEVMDRMGVRTTTTVEREELGEPIGSILVEPGSVLAPVVVGAEELPLVIDEVPVLAALAAHAAGDSRFLGADELRVKESDRIASIVEGIRSLGGDAEALEGSVTVGGGDLLGGIADARGDHRIAMSLTIAALAARRPSEIEGIEAAEVSFPAFVPLLRRLGATIGVTG
jgi:3-phosphoshikimate 1-carboxyvinyltransferase